MNTEGISGGKVICPFMESIVCNRKLGRDDHLLPSPPNSLVEMEDIILEGKGDQKPQVFLYALHVQVFCCSAVNYHHGRKKIHGLY